MPDHRISRLLRTKLLRRASGSAVPSAATDLAFPPPDPAAPAPAPAPASASSDSALFASGPGFLKPRAHSVVSSSALDQPGSPALDSSGSAAPAAAAAAAAAATPSTPATRAIAAATTTSTTPSPAPPLSQATQLPSQVAGSSRDPLLTPSLDPVSEAPLGPSASANPPAAPAPPPPAPPPAAPAPPAASASVAPPSIGAKRPSLVVRRQSLLPSSQQHLVSDLLNPGILFPNSAQSNSFRRPNTANTTATTTTTTMAFRKVWVKRPGGSATLISIPEDSLVDELRDLVVRKYSNSIGRSFDAPDVLVRISPAARLNPQQQRQDSSSSSSLSSLSCPERLLNPEEQLAEVLDTYYPDGQSVDDALLVEIPHRRTPKPSPRLYYHHPEPGEHGEYFPLMPANVNGVSPSTHAQNPSNNAHQAPSISILTTGVPPPLPSPGTRSRHPRRPPLNRHNTNSPTMIGPVSVKDNGIAASNQSSSPAPNVPTPPAPPPESPQTKALTPPTRGPSPRPSRKPKKPSTPYAAGSAFGGLIEGTVPPINVLIVEDNIINQKLLEAFMKRLSVRWKCAANGEEAVRKWRRGGFHLVLMDIQLPVMNGLEAAKEIRRLERLNGIGVFPKTASGRSSVSSTNATTTPTAACDDSRGPLKDEDVLHDLSLFRSPVIIVALTASSLQSDRHEALAAGCNDFLTKPVGFPWLEQKVTEWGCMQALIDFEGWRKWRGFADSSSSSSSSSSPSSPRASSPTIDSAASPMETGRSEHVRRGETAISSAAPTATAPTAPSSIAAAPAVTTTTTATATTTTTAAAAAAASSSSSSSLSSASASPAESGSSSAGSPGVSTRLRGAKRDGLSAARLDKADAAV